MKSIAYIVGGTVLGFAILAAFFYFSTMIVVWAWNFTVPSLFHGPMITFWQAFALVVLLSALTGGFRVSVRRG